MAKTRKSQADLFTPPPIDSVELIRRAYPELTRCVVCQELGQTRRHVIKDQMDETRLTVWLHEHCAEFFVEPSELQYAYQEPLRIFAPKVPSSGSVVRRATERMIERGRDRRYRPSRPQPHRRCFCCEHHEHDDHRAHRISVGYHPQRPWPGRLEPGEILHDFAHDVTRDQPLCATAP
jgi:hypothetical protein